MKKEAQRQGEDRGYFTNISYANTFLHLSWGSDLVLFSKLSTSEENKQILKEVVSTYEEKKLKRITT